MDWILNLSPQHTSSFHAEIITLHLNITYTNKLFQWIEIYAEHICVCVWGLYWWFGWFGELQILISKLLRKKILFLVAKYNIGWSEKFVHGSKGPVVSCYLLISCWVFEVTRRMLLLIKACQSKRNFMKKVFQNHKGLCVGLLWILS